MAVSECTPVPTDKPSDAANNCKVESFVKLKASQNDQNKSNKIKDLQQMNIESACIELSLVRDIFKVGVVAASRARLAPPRVLWHPPAPDHTNKPKLGPYGTVRILKRPAKVTDQGELSSPPVHIIKPELCASGPKRILKRPTTATERSKPSTSPVRGTKTMLGTKSSTHKPVRILARPSASAREATTRAAIPGPTTPPITPTATPIAVPTAAPTAAPTANPTAVPTAAPTAAPVASLTAIPTATPTATTTANPATVQPTAPTSDLSVGNISRGGMLPVPASVRPALLSANGPIRAREVAPTMWLHLQLMARRWSQLDEVATMLAAEECSCVRGKRKRCCHRCKFVTRVQEELATITQKFRDVTVSHRLAVSAQAPASDAPPVLISTDISVHVEAGRAQQCDIMREAVELQSVGCQRWCCSAGVVIFLFASEAIRHERRAKLAGDSGLWLLPKQQVSDFQAARRAGIGNSMLKCERAPTPTVAVVQTAENASESNTRVGTTGSDSDSDDANMPALISDDLPWWHADASGDGDGSIGGAGCSTVSNARDACQQLQASATRLPSILQVIDGAYGDLATGFSAKQRAVLLEEGGTLLLQLQLAVRCKHSSARQIRAANLPAESRPFLPELPNFRK